MGARVSEVREGVLLVADGRRINAGIVLAGMGVVPETTVAEQAGLAIDDRIIVDANSQTSDPSIFAAGDVTRQFHPFVGDHIRLESWENANLLAANAARAMRGMPTGSTPVAAPWVWSDQGDLNLQISGIPDRNAITVTHAIPGEPVRLTAFQLAQEPLKCIITIDRAKDMVLLRRLFAKPDRPLDRQKLADPAVAIRDLIRQRPVRSVEFGMIAGIYMLLLAVAAASFCALTNLTRNASVFFRTCFKVATKSANSALLMSAAASFDHKTCD